MFDRTILGRDEARQERAVALARECDTCEVVDANLTQGSGEVFDLCDRHYWQLVGEVNDEDAVPEDAASVGNAKRDALASFGVDVDQYATAENVAELDVESVAAGVPDDPDALHVLGVLATLHPEVVADQSEAVEACLYDVGPHDQGSYGAASVLAGVVTVDAAAARALLAAVETDDVDYHHGLAVLWAVGRDSEVLLALTDDTGRSLLVETIAYALRTGARSPRLYAVARRIARERPEAFADHLDVLAGRLESPWHHEEDAAAAFDAAAALGRTVRAAPDAADAVMDTLLDIRDPDERLPVIGVPLRAASAAAYAHAPALKDRHDVSTEWLRSRLQPTLEYVELHASTREEAVRAYGRFAEADDREYLALVAEGSTGEVAEAARRAADGAFALE